MNPPNTHNPGNIEKKLHTFNSTTINIFVNDGNARNLVGFTETAKHTSV